MSALLAELWAPFTFDYMWKAMWVSALVGGTCAFLSCYLMLKGWSLMGDALSHSIVPGVAGAYMLGLPFGSNGVIITILFVTFLLGFFLDWIEISLIVLPLVAPVVQGLGFDLVWFTVMFAVCLQTSFLTPPFGFALFYLRGVAPPELATGAIYRGVVPFIIIQLLAMAALWYWPEMATGLPPLLKD